MNAPMITGMSLTMSSREIAELTGKDHKNVLADAEKMLKDLGISPAEFSARYKDAQGKPRKCLNLPKRETLILVSGYNVKMRARIIDRWQELEAKVASPAVPKTLSEALRLAAVFRKQHRNVLRDIRNLVESAPTEFARLNFEQCYSNNDLANGKPEPYYTITRDGFALLAMGFTGKKALAFKVAYIEAFNEMASFIKNQREGLTYRLFADGECTAAELDKYLSWRFNPPCK